MFFFKKKKPKAFGNNIEPSCSYCRYIHNGNCVLGKGDKVCKKYEYDPLKREPSESPSLGDFSADDFML